MVMPVKDAQRRAILLNWFYEQRHKVDWVGLPAQMAASQEDRTIGGKICHQLDENGLIRWRGSLDGDGLGQITASGVDVIEGNARSPIAISIDNRTYSVSGSMGVQFGEGNRQDIRIDAERISAAIDQSGATIREKEEAKSLWERVLSNPVLAKIIGG